MSVPGRKGSATVRRAAAAVLVSMLVAAGCASDDASDLATTDDDATSGPAATEVEPEPDGVDTDDADGADDGADAEAEAVEDLDACALLEGADLEAILGAPAAAGESEFLGHGHTCRIEALGEDWRASLTLRISTSHGPENYDGQRESVGVDAEVTGLGDAAFHSGPYLGVLLGDRFLLLHVLADASSDFRAADEDLEAAMATVVAALSD